MSTWSWAVLRCGRKIFASPRVIQLGHPPNRIDLLTAITGVSFEEAWENREPGELDGVPVHFIGRKAFIRNKRAAGRFKDLADVESLGEQP